MQSIPENPTLLIDGDGLVYRSAIMADKLGMPLTYMLDNMLRNIFDDLQTDDYRLYLTGKDNFRYKVYPRYKGHRPEERPVLLEDTRTYAIEEWLAEPVDGMEADDKIGIEMYKGFVDKDLLEFSEMESNLVAVSYDKDFYQIPGWFCRLDAREERKYHWQHTTEDEGFYYFCKQMLEGDRADNVPGIPKVGPVKAGRLLGESKNATDLITIVSNSYVNNSVAHSDLLAYADCLWILKEEGVYGSSFFK